MPEDVHHVQRNPPKRNRTATIADFTMLVHVPGQPAAAQVFTNAEHDDAHRYAAQTGGTVIPLPLTPPSGYAPDASGNLVPLITVAHAE